MTQKLRTCVVQIRGDHNSQSIAGAGFVIDSETVVTCFHVVKTALEASGRQVRNHEPVIIAFTLNNREFTAQIQEHNQNRDIAVLNISTQLPDGVIPAIVGPSIDVEGHDFSAFGFPVIDHLIGSFAYGTILGLVSSTELHEVLQIRSQEISTGMSGAPVLDREGDRVVGMVTEAYTTTGSRFRDMAIAIPSETLRLVWEKLRLYPPSSTRFIVPIPPNPNFVGRVEELTLLHMHLIHAKSPVGIRSKETVWKSGIGKTQLSIEYAHTYRDYYKDGIYWIDASDTLTNGFSELAKALKIVETDTSHRSAASRAYQYLKTRPDALLILDNLLEPTALLKPLDRELCLRPVKLPCRILFTTQRRKFPRRFQAIEIDILAEETAVNLLFPPFSEVIQEPQIQKNIVGSLGNLLGWLPLAMKLAGTLLREYKITLQDYLEQIKEYKKISSLDDAGGIPKELIQRHRIALQTALRVQWKHLDDDHTRLLFRTIGQFASQNTIPISWLKMLTGISPAPFARALRKLHNLSLIDDLANDHIRMHPAIHSFAASLTRSNRRQRFREELEANLMATLDEDTARLELALHAGECLLSIEWQPYHMRTHIIRALRQVVTTSKVPHDCRAAGMLLLRLRWFDDTTDIPINELENYLETVCRFVDSIDDINYLIFKITSTLKHETLHTWSQIHLLVFRAALYTNYGEKQANDQILDQAETDYRLARLNITRLLDSTGIDIDDYRWLARIGLGLGNILITRATILSEEEIAQEVFHSALLLYQEAAEAAENYGRDPILIVTIDNEISSTLASMNRWEEAQNYYKKALTQLETIKSTDPESYARYSALVLQTATLQHWDHGSMLEPDDQAITEYTLGYKHALEAINRLKSVLEKSEEMAYAHYNAAECLLPLESFKNNPLCPYPEPLISACEHWRLAQEIAHDIASIDIEQESLDRLGEYCQTEARTKNQETEKRD